MNNFLNGIDVAVLRRRIVTLERAMEAQMTLIKRQTAQINKLAELTGNPGVRAD